jgi:hypothetical protein
MKFGIFQISAGSYRVEHHEITGESKPFRALTMRGAADKR